MGELNSFAVSIAMSNEGDGEPNGSNNNNDAIVAKTAGFVVFSRIAVSILKALKNPFNNNNTNTETCHQSPPPSRSQLFPPSPPPPEEPIIQKKNEGESSSSSDARHTVEIVRGDTLWGLSRKYRVTIDAIREANGNEGDTIYAGKKLIIP